MNYKELLPFIAIHANYFSEAWVVSNELQGVKFGVWSLNTTPHLSTMICKGMNNILFAKL